MNNKIYIRADGSPKIGLGHIIRCFALAKMLKDSFSIKFVSMHIPEDIETTFITEGFAVTKISKEEDFFDLLKGDEVVVLDHYGLDSSYQKRIKKIGSKSSLYCSPGHFVGFHPFTKDEIKLKKYLFNHQVKRKFQYSLEWKKNQLAIWDNRSMLHQATPFKGNRIMHRITIQ